jgi:NAD(P)-dependent dehydrogenase (short-subunit alcohol dehydrogenase family)
MDNRVVLITGASSGFGRETALELARRGFVVYGAARRLERMRDLTEQSIRIVSLDVTDDASIVACVERVLAETGRIDALVNNAGYGALGALEDVPLAEARRQFEVNVFGLARMTQQVIPAMRQQGFGRIVNVASVAGRFCVPFGAWYSASKFAVEAISDGLRYELQSFGVDVIVIEPGMIRTEWNDIALDGLRAASGQGAYATEAAKVAASLSRLYRCSKLSPPRKVACTIADALSAPRPKTRYFAGRGARTLVVLRALLSDRWFDRATRLMMNFVR